MFFFKKSSPSGADFFIKPAFQPRTCVSHVCVFFFIFFIFFLVPHLLLLLPFFQSFPHLSTVAGGGNPSITPSAERRLCPLTAVTPVRLSHLPGPIRSFQLNH